MQLGIIFAERLKLAILPPYYLASFRADGVPYLAIKSDVIFLHDRLLDGDGQLMGILLWCFPSDGIDATLAAQAPLARPYLVRNAASSATVAMYEVHFWELTATQADTLVSDGSQSFGDQIFQSPDGELAITVDLADLVDTESLADGDLTASVAPAAHWSVITDLVEFRVDEA